MEELGEVLRHYPIRDENNVNTDRVYEALKWIANGFDLGWDDDQISKFKRTTQNYGTKYIVLLTKQEYTYYLALESEHYVVADYNKVGHRYFKEWERI